ncbi:MAG: EF-hand domain-containing protein [Planctomycetota bacterium]
MVALTSKSISLVIFLAFASASFAQSEAPANGFQQNRDGVEAPRRQKIREHMQHADANGDRAIDRREFPGRPKRLERPDRNSDGQLDSTDRAEHRKQVRERVRTRIRQADENRDGRLSRSEFPGHDERFARLDANGDGFIDRAEFAQAMKKRRDQRGAADDNRLDRPKVDREGARERIRARLRALDTNGDRRIERSEFPGQPTHFDRLDRNGDGAIDRSDRPERKERSHRKHAEPGADRRRPRGESPEQSTPSSPAPSRPGSSVI